MSPLTSKVVTLMKPSSNPPRLSPFPQTAEEEMEVRDQLDRVEATAARLSDAVTAIVTEGRIRLHALEKVTEKVEDMGEKLTTLSYDVKAMKEQISKHDEFQKTSEPVVRFAALWKSQLLRVGTAIAAVASAGIAGHLGWLRDFFDWMTRK